MERALCGAFQLKYSNRFPLLEAGISAGITVRNLVVSKSAGPHVFLHIRYRGQSAEGKQINFDQPQVLNGVFVKLGNEHPLRRRLEGYYLREGLGADNQPPEMSTDMAGKPRNRGTVIN